MALLLTQLIISWESLLMSNLFTCISLAKIRSPSSALYSTAFFVAFNPNLTAQLCLYPLGLNRTILVPELIFPDEPSMNKFYVEGSTSSIIFSILRMSTNFVTKFARVWPLIDRSSCLENDIKFTEFNCPF